MLSEHQYQQIESFLQGQFPDVFIVEMTLKSGKASLLLLRVDTDAGISMEACTDVSRKLNDWLFENPELIPGNYRIEVSSPGVGSPLRLTRQYPANIGRSLRVVQKDKSEWEGILREVTGTGIALELPAPKGMKKKDAALLPLKTIAFSDIKEAKVIIVF
jgi:ribosome maturation factor RimP